MKKLLIAAAVGAALSSTAYAQSAQDRAVLDQLKSLSDRVQKLEAENAELKNKTATQKDAAEDKAQDAKIAELEKKVKASDWASRIQWKGDFRMRHENVDPEEAVTDQTRERIRARFGLTAKVNDTISATIQLATNGGNGDPRSTNQTIGNGFDRKGVAIDLAYADWAPVKGLNIQLGKMPIPWVRTAGYVWDGDITPEGAAFKFANGPFFASAFSYVLSERSTASDATLTGAQVGIKFDAGPAKLTGAIGYFDTGAVQGKVTAQPTGCATAFNPAFFGGAQGNTTTTVAGCPRLTNDFNMLEGLVQADFKLGDLPLSAFVDYIQNQDGGDLDTGYAGGVILGKASDPMTWEVGVIYQKMEKNAQFGQFVDSDFGGGVTDTKGTVLRAGFAPAKNWVLNGTYFKNKRFNDVGTQRDYDRYQIDLNYKF